MSINDAKWTVWPVFLASAITSFFLTFVSCHAGIFSIFPHSFSTAAFASGIFMAWGTGINLCTRLQWLNELMPLPCDVVFMVLALRPFHAYPHRFIGLNNISIFRLVLSSCATGLSVLLKLKSTRHRCWHRIIKFDKENTTQSPGIFELVQLPSWYRFELLPSLVHCCLRIRKLSACGLRALGPHTARVPAHPGVTAYPCGQPCLPSLRLTGGT